MRSVALLPSGHAGRVGECVRDALFAIEVGLLAPHQEHLMYAGRARALTREVHVTEIVAVAAIQRIVRLQAGPFMLGLQFLVPDGT